MRPAPLASQPRGVEAGSFIGLWHCSGARYSPGSISIHPGLCSSIYFTRRAGCVAVGHGGLIRSLDRSHLVLHAGKLAGAAFEARVQEHTPALSHRSSPSQHTKLIIFLHRMHFSAENTTKSIVARVLGAYMYANTELEKISELFSYIGDSWRHASSLRRGHRPQCHSRYAATRPGVRPKVLRSCPI